MNRQIAVILFLVALALGACGAAAPQLTAGEPPADFERGLIPGQPFDGDDAGGEAFAEEAASAAGAEFQVSERIVIKNANLSLVVDDPGISMTAIADLADSMGGFVVSSNLFQTTLANGVEVPRATITIRVPAERLGEALAQIEARATRVLSRNESGEDVTREYTDLQSRLRNLEQAEAQLREIMDEATKTEDVLNVYNQLVGVTEQIEIIRGQIQYFEQSAAFSAISVDLLANEAVQPLTIAGWQPAGVARNAIQALINTLQSLVNALIWIVLYILPVLVLLLVPLAFLWRGFRSCRQRRKSKSEE